MKKFYFIILFFIYLFNECYSHDNKWVHQKVTIEYSYDKPDLIELYLYTATAQLIKKENINNNIGVNHFHIDFSKYTTGAYFVVLKSGNDIGFCNFIYLP